MPLDNSTPALLIQELCRELELDTVSTSRPEPPRRRVQPQLTQDYYTNTHCTMPPAGPSLQAFRLSLYVALPVAATVLYSQPSVMNQIIAFFNYTVYPPAGPPPPTADEMEQLMKERRAKR